MPIFCTQTRDDPLELVKILEHIMHITSRAVYLTLTLIETITSMVSIKQGEKEGLATYLERFKSGKNLTMNLFGSSILDGYVENMATYRDIITTDIQIVVSQK